MRKSGRSSSLTKLEPIAEKGKKKKIINERANVNSYKHFLAVPTSSDPYIKWASGLRDYNHSKILATSGSMPPEVYYKSTESSKVVFFLFSSNILQQIFRQVSTFPMSNTLHCISWEIILPKISFNS